MNPETGRFLSRDSDTSLISDPASLAKYLYANDDPVNRVDPSGHQELAEELAAVDVNATLDEIATPALNKVRKRLVKMLVCDVLPDLAFQGIYNILLNGVPYVGQSSNIAVRLAQWEKEFEVEIVQVIKVFPFVESSRPQKFARELVEDFLFKGLGGKGGPLGNKINPVDPAKIEARIAKHFAELSPAKFKELFKICEIGSR
jgi:hypothetical protein